MAKLNLNKFKENADKIVQERSTQGLFSESQNKLVALELDLLRASEFPIRLNDSNLEELSESIETFTQVEPITVAKHKNKYEILNGHARVKAIKLSGGDSALCVIINIPEDDAAFYQYLLNKNLGLDDFEIAYYVERLLASGVKEKTIQKKLSLDVSKYKSYNFEYNLFDVLKNSEIITYKHLKDVAEINDESMRDETLDHIVQKLINQTEIENYLAKVKENDLGSRFSMKSDGVKIKKNGSKTSMDLDEKHLSFDEIRKVYAFIADMSK